MAQEQQINPETLEDADVFALHAECGQACVQVFFFRAGQNWGNRAYFPRVDKSDEDPDVMSAFLGQFYEDKPIPRLIQRVRKNSLNSGVYRTNPIAIIVALTRRYSSVGRATDL